MGVWLRARGRLEVLPPPDDKLQVDFWRFSCNTWPEDYRRMDESFANSWFFDEDNRLASTAGKFAEPCVWYDWMKEHFFDPRGYKLVGDLDIIGEETEDLWDLSIEEEYAAWKKRVIALCQKEVDNHNSF